MTGDPGRLRPLVEEAGALVPGVEVAVGLVRAPPPRPARAAVAPVVAPLVAVAERRAARQVRHGALVVVCHALAPPRQLDGGGLGGGGVVHHRFRGGGVVGRGLRHVEGGAGGGMAEHREVNSQYLVEEARHDELVWTRRKWCQN